MVSFLDIIGLVGVCLVVYSYFLIQTEKISVNDLKYSLYNLVGSFLIILTLIWNFNLSSFLIEIFWFGISVLGLVRYFRRREV